MRVTDLALAEAPAAEEAHDLGARRAPRPARCDVAVIGAGPYGLAAAAHLNAAGLATRAFGDPMVFWRRHMPKGMKLRHATDIAAQPALSLDAFLHDNGIASSGPLAIEHFIAYGDRLQRRAVPEVDRRTVLRVAKAGNRFELKLDDGATVEAGRVVVALGLKNQEYRPPPFAQLPATLVSHSCAHADFADFRGRRVAVIGRGQSACESAVLLSEAGAQAEIVCRGPIHWIGSETPGQGPVSLRWRLHDLLTPKFAIGPFPLNWLADSPNLLRRTPRTLRSRIATRCLRAAATAWLRPRAGGIRVHAGRAVLGVEPMGNRVSLRLDDGDALPVDHVLLGTGYQVDIRKYGILPPDLLGRVERVDGYPVLSAGFESSVPGLHFLGACAAGTFGPMLRFVAGTGYAARALVRAALASRRP